MSSNNTYYKRNKEQLQENHQESTIIIMKCKKHEIYLKNYNEIWDKKLSNKTIMFLITKIKLYVDEMRKKYSIASF